MADPVIINPTLTLAGQAAAFNASNNGLELKITHVSFGKAHYDPSGHEVALVEPVGNKVAVAGASRPTPYQIRMVSTWREDVGQVGIGEIAFWAGDVLVFVWSKADGTVASYKTDGVSYVLFNDLAFSSVPANSVSFVVDPNESVALAALMAHEGSYNAHPQYALRARFPDYQGHLWGDVAGTANAIELTLPAIVELTQYIKGNRFSFKATKTNTADTTINVAGVGAVQVLKTGGVPLTAGSIVAGGVYDVYYDGAKFQLTAGAGFASAEATDAEVTDLTAVNSTSWVSLRRLIKALVGFAKLVSPTFTGLPKAPTPDLFDNSKLIATTEFVARASGNYRGFTSLTSAAALTTAAAGTIITAIGTFTITLPLASSMTLGGAIHFLNIGGGVVTVECPAGDSYNVGSGAHPTSIALPPGASLTVVTSPTQAAWWAFGSGQLQYARVNGYTAPQFDNSKLLATTEFVQRALGNCKDLVVVSANTVLTPAQVGSYVTSNVGAGSVNVGLPLLSSVAPGSTFVITHSSSSMASFAVAISGSDSLVFDGLAGTAAPYPMAVGEVLTVVSTGAAWKVTGGNGARVLKNGGAFAAQLAGAGSQLLPSGLIRKWGTVVTSASGAVTVTMPSAFPTACIRASASMTDTVNPSIVSADIVSASQIRVSGFSGQSVPLPRVATIASWEAIGY